MTARTLSGFLGVLILPDETTVRQAVELTKRKDIASAEHVTKPEGMHITLYQAKHFTRLPVSVAERVVGKLNGLLSDPDRGARIAFEKVAPHGADGRYLFWHVDNPASGGLQLAHHMSLALSAWVKPVVSQPRFTYLFGSENVAHAYVPHITLAADTNGFPGFEPFSRNISYPGISRVVFARMGEWGKIDEILF